MDLLTQFDSSSDFIELHRTFHELSETTVQEDEVLINRMLGVGGRLTWSDLIKEYRLIILSEAGSGKTYEIRHAAQALKQKEKPAFFLRLEHMPRDFEDAFEVGTYEEFEEWLASGEEGWLLLDSVDEARLRDPGDFELAIRRLGSLISKAKDRTHVVISGRTTAWRPKTDLAYCTAHLPYTVRITSELDTQVDDEGSGGSLQTETETQDKAKPVFKIVSLDDLTSDQIAVFAKARGIEDNRVLLDAVERADAWSFTSRPQDLEELIGFWKDKGQIGTRLELMRNSIDRRLVERDQGRADTRPLAVGRARQGARLLAAATTLAQDPSIRVPDGTENSRGIAVRSVLPDWDDKEQSILLSRPIFDEEIYGTVRFHHRSVREYLTAEWFDELLRRETSRRTIEMLFFRNQYGLDIVVPMLRPILPWLSILDEKIRGRVLKVAPEIIFEGGDPSQLPLEVRRYILHKVCRQIADGNTARSIHDYAAVQRFSNTDLTDDVRKLLRKYSENEHLTAFLLRMVWLGELAGALPEAMDLALTPTTEEYVRIATFRAIKAIGSEKDLQDVRRNFLAEASELKRQWLAELVEGVQLTEQTLIWLLACLEKCEPREPYTVDRLTGVLTESADTADIEQLPHLVTGLNRLLSFPPLIEHPYCNLSEKFFWLMEPASRAVERLVLERHPASLEPDTLATLHRFSAAPDSRIDKLADVKTKFTELVPAWEELNRALFWFEVQRSREAIATKHRKRLTKFRQTSIFGGFWRFEVRDFEYVAKEIARRVLLDDKLVALSLAFDLYKAAKRPRAWRDRLKKMVSGNKELSRSLGTLLKPPPQDQDEHYLKKRIARLKRQEQAFRKKQEKYHENWKKYLNNNLEKAQAALLDNPGTIINPLIYLNDQTRVRKHSSTRWTEYNWKILIPEYGEKVARFYRDSTVSFWRHYEPKLRSEGAPLNKTTYGVIIGLTGLEIEASETIGWPKNLNAEEVKLACKYASFELNGFPTWFPKLFEVHPKIVCDFLMQEILYELSIEKPERDTHYLINDVSWTGHWAWDHLALDIYDLLKREPKNLSNLDSLLKILQGSSLRNVLIEKLASRKCRTLKNSEHLARWFAVWTGVAPDSAISALRTRIEKIADLETQSLFAMTFITHLWGGLRGDGATVRQAFKTPDHLKSLYLLMNEHIRHEQDIRRAGTGAYSPGLRDNAQDARNSLFNSLIEIPGKKSFLALNEIANMHLEEASRPWIFLHAKRKAEPDGDIEPWSTTQVREFHEELERTPSNHRELAELAVLRILDLKHDLEQGDSSVAEILREVKQEPKMRKYIGRELREKSLGRYSIPQEEELADAKKPDLRFHGVGFDGPVPVELKLADKSHWSGSKLLERLENQLCGDYLRDNRSRRGIFLLVYRGKRPCGWTIPGSNSRVDFQGLTAALQDHWGRISPQFPNIDNITVIGIDLTKRSN